MREQGGALELESVELRFQLSADGNPQKIKTPDGTLQHVCVSIQLSIFLF